MTGTAGPSARTSSSPSRLVLGVSTVTTRSWSSRRSAGAASNSRPGSALNDSGRGVGAEKLTWTSVPARASTKPRASAAPTVSASGWTWHRIAIDLGSEYLDGTGGVDAPSGPAALSRRLDRRHRRHPDRCRRRHGRDRRRRPGWRRRGSGPRRRRPRGPGQQLLHAVCRIGHGVTDEGQRRGELHPGARPTLVRSTPLALSSAAARRRSPVPRRGSGPAPCSTTSRRAGHRSPWRR